ncbi:MAG: DUF6774 domain-containing protein [Lachnospiraceae bacterium]
MNACEKAAFITGLACRLFQCSTREELEVLAVDLVQLADTIAAMLVNENVCAEKETEEA